MAETKKLMRLINDQGRRDRNACWKIMRRPYAIPKNRIAVG